MNDTSTTSETLAIEGFTPYAQVPRWVLRSQGNLSHGAVRLYGVIMSYADNSTKAAFPGRQRLAEDMGSNLRSISRFIKELEDYAALRVERRRNKRTGNFYANHYVLVFNEPDAEYGTRRDAVNGPVTTLTLLNIDSPSFTSEQSSDNQKESFTPEKDSDSIIVDNSKSNPGNLTPEARAALRKALQKVGQSIKDGHGFYSDRTQDLWWGFMEGLELIMPDEYPSMAEIIENGKWTVSAAVASPYAAGRELNVLINTAAQL